MSIWTPTFIHYKVRESYSISGQWTLDCAQRHTRSSDIRANWHIFTEHFLWTLFRINPHIRLTWQSQHERHKKLRNFYDWKRTNERAHYLLLLLLFTFMSNLIFVKVHFNQRHITSTKRYLVHPFPAAHKPLSQLIEHRRRSLKQTNPKYQRKWTNTILNFVNKVILWNWKYLV